jgi:RecB family endonuclease NucS
LDTIVKLKPSLREVEEVVRESIAGHRLVVIVGECRVDYEGRAASRLELGERVVLIKQDGAVLIHGPTGYSPINWQPSTSAIEVFYREDAGLVIHAVRDKPREYLTITFTRVEAVVAGKLVDPGGFTMYVDESEMRDVLAANPSLIEEGFRVLEVEKPISDGYVDIYGVDRESRPVLVELKRVTATREAALQLYRYVEAYMREKGVRPRGILLAPAFSPSAIESLLRMGLEYRYVDLKKIWELVKKHKVWKRQSLLSYTKGEQRGGATDKA